MLGGPFCFVGCGSEYEMARSLLGGYRARRSFSPAYTPNLEGPRETATGAFTRRDKDRLWNRAVKVVITAPDVSRFETNAEEVQALAQKAWRSPTKKIVEGPITVKVEAFGR